MAVRVAVRDGRGRRVGGSATSPESVAGLSSGGFSNKWKRPAWQIDATAAYLSQTTTPLPGSRSVIVDVVIG